MILTAIITNWIIKKKVIKFGKIYDATVVGYKGIFRFPIVQFVCNNKTIEVGKHENLINSNKLYKEIIEISKNKIIEDEEI